jgi:hypothetical protein
MAHRSSCLALSLLSLAATGLAAQAPASQTPPPNTLSAAERAAGWRLLFDGRSTAGWRGYKKATLPSGWRVVGGTLSRMSGGGDIVTTQQFRNFELTLEWNVAQGGNSGIFYRASEDEDGIYWTAPEMQVLDDAHHPDGESRLTSAGANYGLDSAPPGIVKPAGEWNQARLVVNGNHVEHWLNGVKVVEYELGSPAWEAKVKASKFAPHVHYGRNAEGYIGLQDHGDWVAFRTIKIRVLP